MKDFSNMSKVQHIEELIEEIVQLQSENARLQELVSEYKSLVYASEVSSLERL